MGTQPHLLSFHSEKPSRVSIQRNQTPWADGMDSASPIAEVLGILLKDQVNRLVVPESHLPVLPFPPIIRGSGLSFSWVSPACDGVTSSMCGVVGFEN